jgi:signal transduction histidine kinase
MKDEEKTKEQLLAELADARKQAQESRLALVVERDRVKILADFIRDASNEFRTPLAVINTILYLLERQTDPEQQVKRTGVLKEQTAYLHDLIEDMLAMSRLESTEEFEFKLLNLNDVIRSAGAKIQPLAKRKEISLTLDLDTSLPMVEGDRMELQRALGHIIGNALEYSSARAEITISTRLTDTSIEVEVRDSGMGISELDLPHVFEHFYKINQIRTTAQGASLGLSIAQKVIAAHQGRIQVEHAAGYGSVFRISLPHYTPCASNT